MKKKSSRKKRNETEEAGSYGGARKGAGRKKGGHNKSTLEFRDAAREHTDRAIALYVSVMDNVKYSIELRMEAANWLVERGYGKAPQEITGPNEGPVQVEYRSFDEMRAYLLTMGIDYDRLPPPRMLERHQMIDVTKNGSTNN
jgi:hypothetical protein